MHYLRHQSLSGVRYRTVGSRASQKLATVADQIRTDRLVQGLRESYA